jgi:hypothetical protein
MRNRPLAYVGALLLVGGLVGFYFTTELTGSRLTALVSQIRRLEVGTPSTSDPSLDPPEPVSRPRKPGETVLYMRPDGRFDPAYHRAREAEEGRNIWLAEERARAKVAIAHERRMRELDQARVLGKERKQLEWHQTWQYLCSATVLAAGTLAISIVLVRTSGVVARLAQVRASLRQREAQRLQPPECAPCPHCGRLNGPETSICPRCEKSLAGQS